VRKRAPTAAVAALDPSTSRPDLDDAVRKLSACEEYVVAAFASVSAYRGSVALAGELPSLVESLIATGRPLALVALGNPYLLRGFPNVTAYLATFSTVPPSELAAVKALFGEIDIRGHLPVSIPGMAQYGDGIQVRAPHPPPPEALQTAPPQPASGPAR
jgi:beta-N-acetylhexosaminidase